MLRRIDLHVHSNASDGTCKPAELVELALEKGLAAFALTDHDTTDGIAEAISAARDTDLEVVPGIELSTEYNGKDVHVLGYDIDYENEAFLEKLKWFKNQRDVRNEEMLEKLYKHGFEKMTMDNLMRAYPDAVITRAHFARYMLECGYIKNTKEAFDKYIGDECPFFVPRRKITPNDAIEFILKYGGIPVLAHPLLYGMDKEALRTAILSFKEAGLVGIEAIYSLNSGADERRMKKLAGECGLRVTGGSDFHGTNKPGIYMGTGKGNLYVPYECLEALRHYES
ncbi:MAG: PHP domain-containing protein [Lachnospiraceae bacterium]|nr:PHP domain-containing protein [Lachnospiraceae bacterium]